MGQLTDGVDRLRGQWSALRRHPGSGGAIAAVPAAAKQGQHLDGIDAVGYQGDGVAVGGEQPVLLEQCQDTRDLTGLLATARRDVYTASRPCLANAAACVSNRRPRTMRRQASCSSSLEDWA